MFCSWTISKCLQKMNIQTIRIYSQGFGMEFDIEICYMLIMKSGNRKTTEGIQLSIKKETTLGENDNYQYLAVL